jgi:hypothetical protein
VKIKNLIYDEKDKIVGKKIIMFNNVESIRVLANPVTWHIMEILSQKPMYPAQIAKELRIHEQSAYYYIRKLIGIGAVKEKAISHIRGGTARLFEPSSPSFGIEMNWGERQFDTSPNVTKNYIYAQRFFAEYTLNRSFNGLIVVGAPDPHGPYKSSAKDGHYAVQLAFFLGTLCNGPSDFVVKLDVNTKAERIMDERNLICVGGPGTNIITAEVNKYLPINFNEKNFWLGLVDSHGKVYNADNQGLIAKIKNPYDNKRNVIIVAGVRSVGTKSAIIGLTNYSQEILKTYDSQEKWALVVQGFDMNADGKIDHVDIVSEV